MGTELVAAARALSPWAACFTVPLGTASDRRVRERGRGHPRAYLTPRRCSWLQMRFRKKKSRFFWNVVSVT